MMRTLLTMMRASACPALLVLTPSALHAPMALTLERRDRNFLADLEDVDEE